MAELDGIGVAPVLSADTNFNLGVRLAAKNYSDAHKLAHALLINALEGINVQDLGIKVGGQEGSSSIITAVGKGCLREVIGPEAEKLGVLGDLVCSQAGAGNFDHGADLHSNRDALALEHLVELFLNQRLEYLDLINVADKGEHDLGHRVQSSLDQCGSCLGDCTDLQLVDVGIHDSNAAAAEPDHRIELLQLVVPLNDLLQIGDASFVVSRLCPVSYTHLRAHETRHDLVCRLLLE